MLKTVGSSVKELVAQATWCQEFTRPCLTLERLLVSARTCTFNTTMCFFPHRIYIYIYMFRLIVTIHADFSPDGRHRSVFLRKCALCSMRDELNSCTWCTDHRPRDDPARVVGMSGAVRGTSGHMWDYWSVGGSDRQFCYHP